MLQDGLHRYLPSEVLDSLPQGVDIGFAIIPHIALMPEPLKSQVQHAFHTSVHRVWVVLLCTCGAGLMSVSLMRDIPLQSTTDERWGIVDKDEQSRLGVVEVMVLPTDPEAGK